MKKMQRIFSLLLTAGMFFGLFAGLNVTAFADDGVTITFSGADAGNITGAPGTQVKLPSAEATQDGYVFLGWTDAEVAKTQAEPAYYPENSTYILPSENTTLYALYSFVDGRGTPSIDRYEKITSMDAILDGAYLIGVANGGTLRVFDGNSANPNASGNYKDLTLTAPNYIACSADSDACAVRVYQLPDSDAYGIKMGNGNGKYIGSTGSTGMASRGTGPYPLTIDDTNGIEIYVSTAEKNLYLGYYETSSTQKFGFYNNKQTTYADLYRKIDGIDGTLYYTGTQISCDHAGTEGVVTDPTCTENGFTTYLCQTCGYKWVEGGEDAIGHDYVAQEPVPATDYEEGYTLYVCSHCGDSYKDNIVDPTGVYQVTFSILGATTTQNVSYSEGIALPTTVDVNPDGYEFAGWTNIEYKNETEDPYIFSDKDFEDIETGENDHKLHPTSDITLYAIYKRAEEVTGSGDYVKVTEMPANGLNGRFLVVCETKNIAFNSAFADTATNLNKAGNYLSVSIEGNTIEATDDLDNASVEIAPVGTTGNYSMKIKSGLMIGSTGSSTANGINGKSGTVYQNTITINNGTAVIANAAATNTGSNTYNFAYNSSSVNRFAYCKPSTSTVYPSSLYQKQEVHSFKYYYTLTPPTAGCEHEDSIPTYVEPTCTEQGYYNNVCINCGYSWKDDFEDPLGHSYDDGVVTAPTPSAPGYTTYTCTVCGDTYQDNFIGFDFEITYNVLGTDREPVTVNNKDGADFPTDVPEITGYKFAGWAEEAIPEEINDATLLVGHYIPTEDATYYAVYTRKEANDGDGNYYKVTSLPLVENGNYLIVSSDKDGNPIAFKAAEEDNEDYDLTKANNYITVSVSNGVIAESSEADIASITINPIDGTAYYSLAVSETGVYIGNTGSSTGWNTKANNGKNAPYETSITIDAYGYAIMNNVGGSNRYQILFNHATNSDKVAFYASTNKTCDPVSLYLKDGSGFTTYYTTNPTGETPHVHEYDSTGECSCGDKLISIDSASLRLDEDIDVIYTAKVPEGATATMTFTMNGKSVAVEDDGFHEFAFEGVNPQCMGDNIEATLTVTVGDKTYTDTKAEYSVRTYCVNTLAKEDISDATRKLVSDTLAYGAAAQTYMSYKTNGLVTSGVTGTSYSTFATLSGLAPTFTGTAVESPCWIGAGLTLTDDVAMTFRFYAESVEGLIVTVKINNRTEEFTEFTPVDGKENVYEITFKGIKATEFDDAVTASFPNGNTVSYSVNTYVCSKQATSDANLAALVKALYNYGASAVAFSPKPQLEN